MKESIRDWMRSNLARFIDNGEVDCTSMVESWDYTQADGTETLSSSYPAWDIAIEVQTEYLRKKRG